MGWNFGDMLEMCDEVKAPDAPALIHAGVTTTWGDFARRSNNLARGLVEQGAQPGDKVAIYLRNCAEYMETLAACFKARLVPVNVNYRYLDDELHYILDNSDSCFCVFGGEFIDRVENLRKQLAETQWLQVGGTPADWAVGFNETTEKGSGEPLNLARCGDDLLFIYTGGTTGNPKAVMWEQHQLWNAMGGGLTQPANAGEAPASLDRLRANVKAYEGTPTQLTACPLMHGSGLISAVILMVGGGCNITLSSKSLDCVELWQAVQDHSVQSMVIVGDVFARPMLKCLQDNPGRWRLDSLQMMVSSGVMWSKETKEKLLEIHPGMLLADMFGSSEGLGFGSSISAAGGDDQTARFVIGPECKVFTEDHRPVKPGSGERGFIARSGAIPLGYYKDPEKTAKTFPTIDGVRYSIPGDWCTVEADGSLILLGRGSACINSGGEKIFPEEVEECLKTHPSVLDAFVFGLPDSHWGQAVNAVVQLESGTDSSSSDLRDWVKQGLAAYKSPKRILISQQGFRAPNGKADYKAAKSWFENKSAAQSLRSNECR